MEKNPLPPYLFRILAWFCPGHLFEEIEGDLIQKFQRDRVAFGETNAKLRLAWNTLRFFRPGVILRNERFNASGILQLSNHSRNLTFRQAGNLTGWLVFTIALVSYILTVEETASLWDCSEFIAASTKLQVPHPPGAPLFLLTGRIFSLLALDDPTRIAYAVNLLSALASAFTILFLFWSIVLFGRKLTGVAPDATVTEEKAILLLGAGAVGALAYTYSDSFWFSAVEAEVYAMSSFFTAIVVWCILKWDLIENKSRSNRWLILIAFIVGLSIGVHLLNLLTLPALALIYYFKKPKPTTRGVLLTLAVSTTLTLCIYSVVIPGLPSLAGQFELLLVNSMGLSFGSGVFVFSILFVGTLIYWIHFTYKRNLAAWNTLLLAGTFVIIGYGSYATIVIRSGFDPPMNQNAPKDVMSFVRYLNREQYGSRPLLYGPYFTSNPVGLEYGDPVYIKGKDKYEESRRKSSYAYEQGSETILPRAWDPDNGEAYMNIMGLREGERPMFIQNLGYMFTHQIGTMYLRYFMWNFAGRDSDEQGAGWLTPLEWFEKIPVSLANKGRNNFFMIPFALGLIGMSFQYLKDKKSWAVVGVLFVMLGVAIVIYLNSPPVEPRERDYIYTGSYYAFAIWIGLSVIALADAGGRIIKNRRGATLAAVLAGLAAPILMASCGWDDHDRSNRFFSVDSASNMLTSCEPKAVLFTGGDNDSFPLWYAQDAEGHRTDVRALVLGYLNGDWYIDQTTRKVYESDSLSYTLPQDKYRQGGPNDYLPFVNAKIESMDAEEFLRLIADDNPLLKRGNVNIVPSKTITISVDKKAVLSGEIIPEEFKDLVVDKMELRLLDDHLEKRDLVFLDLLVTSNWQRPIYLNSTSLSQLGLDLRPYIVQEGNAYRVLPVKNPDPESNLVNTARSYDLMLNQFRYRGLDDPNVYYNDDYKIQVITHRSNLNSVAQALLDEGEARKAEEVLLFSLDRMPDEAIPYDPSAPDTVSLLFKVGQMKKAIGVAQVICERSTEVADYLLAKDDLGFELRKNLFLLGTVQRTLFENGENDLAVRYEANYERLIAELQRRMKG
jgi:hypothetical protein